MRLKQKLLVSLIVLTVALSGCLNIGVSVDSDVKSAEELSKYEVTMRINGSGWEQIEAMSEMSGGQPQTPPREQMKQNMRENITNAFKSTGNTNVQARNLTDGIEVTATVEDAVPKNSSNITLRKMDNGSILYHDNVEMTLGMSGGTSSLRPSSSPSMGPGPAMGPSSGSGMGGMDSGSGQAMPDGGTNESGEGTSSENTVAKSDNSLTLLQSDGSGQMQGDSGQMPSGSSQMPGSGSMMGGGAAWINATFDYHLEMPGEIVNSTSNNVSGNTATWSDEQNTNLSKAMQQGSQNNQENPFEKEIMAVSKPGQSGGGQPGFGFAASIAALAAVAAAALLVKRD